MNILGLSALYHDSAAALCQSGDIVAAAQEERFTRIKHDPSFPVRSIDYCLREGGLKPDQLDAVVFYDHPLLTLDRWINNLVDLGDDSQVMLDKSFDSIFRQKLWCRRLAQQALPGWAEHKPFLVTKHHVAHAASAFFPSPFQSAAILTMDGVGEWATTTIGRAEGEHLEMIKEIHYPHSLGLLYSAFTYFCGFRVNSGDYKLMGLAPYGRPVYYQTIRDELIDLKPDGSFRLNLAYFDYHRNTVMTNQAMADLFNGPPRQPETEISRREMDLAASIQKVLEEAVLLLGREAARVTGERQLAMAGGVALNCVANGRLLRTNIFEEIWIQPAAGDAGGALGAALYAAHAHFGLKRRVGRRDSQKGSYLGPGYKSEDIRRCLDEVGAVYQDRPKDELYPLAAGLIASGQVVGFFNGRMEFGPRALGARSILADPRNPGTQSRLNLKIKYRESFRPFAPSVLAEDAKDYFSLDCESPYMLLCAEVRPDIRKEFELGDHIPGTTTGALDMLPIINVVRSEIPAVTHVDYSARVQTVHQADSPDYHRLISEFKKLTGCAVLVNTSFNVRGEPIVCSPQDAWLCFMRTDMDALVMENFIMLKKDQTPLNESEDWRNHYALD